MAPPKPLLKTTFVPEKTVQPYYSGAPGCVAQDSSCRLLVAGCDDEAVVIDFCSARELMRIPGDGEDLTALAMTPSASHLVTCSRSQMMHIYSLHPEFSGGSDGEEERVAVNVEHLRQSKMTATAMVCVVDRTGTLVATGGADGILRVWDLRRGFVTHNLKGHGGLIASLAFFTAESAGASDAVGKIGSAPREAEGSKRKAGKKRSKDVRGRFMLASGGDDTTVRVWDLETSVCAATLEGHTSVVRGLDWNADGSRLLSGARDGALCVWDTKSWNNIITSTGEEVEAVAFVPPGVLVRDDGGQVEKLVLSAGRQDRVRVWDLAEGKELTAEWEKGEPDEEKGIMQLIFHKDQRTILSVHHDCTLQTHPLILPTPAPHSLPTNQHFTTNYDEILDLILLPSSIALATNSSAIRILSPNTFVDQALLTGHTDTILSLCADWSGDYLASGGKDTTARLWHLPTNTCLSLFSGHAETISTVALPPTAPQESSKAYINHHPPPFLLTAGSDRTIKKWDISSPVPNPKPRAAYTRRAHEKDINALTISPNSSLFCSASQDRTLKLWSTETGETIGVLRGHRRAVWSAAFSPDQRCVVSASTDKTVRLWSLNDYTCLRTFEGHTNSVQRALWLNGATQLVSAGNDGLVKVWDEKSGECVATLDNHDQRIWALAVRDADDTIFSADAAGIITVWRDVTEATAAEASSRQAELLEQEQQLSNLELAGHFQEAISLSLSLNHPQKLLNLLTRVVEDQKSELAQMALEGLTDGQLTTLLHRVRDWNTNARNAAVAQKVLGFVVRGYDIDRLMGLKGLRGVWEAIEAYSERHLKRTRELADESWIVEYTLGRMDAVLAIDEGDDMEID